MNTLTKKDKQIKTLEATRQQKIEAYKQREAYLKSLGLDQEIFMTLSTLKEVFTDKIIKEHFPTPFCVSLNPNLSKSYQRDHPETMMKMFRLADVMEKIKAGVKPRIKDTLKEEYRKILLATALDTDLTRKPKANASVRKI